MSSSRRQYQPPLLDVQPANGPYRGVLLGRVYATAGEVAEALRVVDLSGAAEMLATWREIDRLAAGKHRGGRKPTFDDRATLALALLVTQAGQDQTVRNMASLAAFGLDAHGRDLLGLPPLDDLEPMRVYERAWRAADRMQAVIDPYYEWTYQYSWVSEVQDFLNSLPADFVANRVERVERLEASLIAASYLMTPRHLRERSNGNLAIDSTAAGTFGSRGEKRSVRDKNGKRRPLTRAEAKRTVAAADPFAGYYVRDSETHGDDLSRPQSRKVLWGYEITLVTMNTNDPKRQKVIPHLVVGMTAGVPSTTPGPHAVRALRNFHDAVTRIVTSPAGESAGLTARDGEISRGFIAADRAYGYTPKAAEYAIPMRELGYRLVWDLHVREMGKIRRVAGGVLLEGNLYCPSIELYPDLVNATLHHRVGVPTGEVDAKGEMVMAKIDEETWRARINERSKFLATRNGRTRTDGSARFTCPAAGPTPTLSCPFARWRSRPRTLRRGRLSSARCWRSTRWLRRCRRRNFGARYVRREPAM